MKTDRPRTIDEFLELGTRPRVIAHRGCSAKCPENTMAAFRQAIECGADMIELDVLFSRDHRLVVIHDDTLDRTTGRSGRVGDYSWDELRELDCGSWFSKDFSNERLALLDDVLNLIRNRILLNIEIKSEAVTDSASGGIAQAVVQGIHDFNLADQVIISSFDPRAILQAREMAPSIKIATLYNRDIQGKLSIPEILEQTGADAFNCEKKEVNKSVVEQCHRLGRPVAVYTVDDAPTMRGLIALGVDALFTNRPDVMLDTIRSGDD